MRLRRPDAGHVDANVVRMVRGKGRQSSSPQVKWPTWAILPQELGQNAAGREKMEQFRIFLSWSGSRSRAIAALLKPWLEDILGNPCDVWMSQESLPKGRQWLIELTNVLSTTTTGIVVLTGENTDATWINFEAGAIWKAFHDSRCCTLLFGINPNDIVGPLSHFQHTAFTKDDVYRMVSQINEARSDQKATPDQILRRFNRTWQDFEKEILNIPKSTVLPEARPPGEVLGEILDIVRELEKRSVAPDSQFADFFQNSPSFVYSPHSAFIAHKGDQQWILPDMYVNFDDFGCEIDIEVDQKQISVGELCRGHVILRNKGSTVQKNIGAMCRMPPEFSVKSSTGPTEQRRAGPDLVFSPIPSLAPQTSAAWEFKAEALKEGEVKIHTWMARKGKISPSKYSIVQIVGETKSPPLTSK